MGAIMLGSGAGGGTRRNEEFSSMLRNAWLPQSLAMAATGGLQPVPSLGRSATRD